MKTSSKDTNANIILYLIKKTLTIFSLSQLIKPTSSIVLFSSSALVVLFG